MAMAESFVESVVGCARCRGEGHEDLTWLPFTRPFQVIIKVDGLPCAYTATHWAMCPTLNEPIMWGTIDVQEDDMPEHQQERENMEDARPEESGTVGDGAELARAEAEEGPEPPDDEAGVEE
jgi:hypothetical protein